MTEKRFRNNGSMIFDNEKPMNTIEVFDLLNEQHEQIQKYKRYFDIPVKDDGSSMNIRELLEENEQLKQQKIDLLRLIDNNIEIYKNINTNVEFHQGEIQGKLTLLYNLREVILND